MRQIVNFSIFNNPVTHSHGAKIGAILGTGGGLSSGMTVGALYDPRWDDSNKERVGAIDRAKMVGGLGLAGAGAGALLGAGSNLRKIPKIYVRVR
jgi:hypothetical protein